MFMWKQNRKILEQIELYLDVVKSVMGTCREGIKAYTLNGADVHFSRLADEAHKYESDADNICRDIELELYKKSLLPESREDILLLLERLDLIPNQAEEILRMIQIQHLKIPEKLHPMMLELISLGEDACTLTREAVIMALNRKPTVQDHFRRIDDMESIADRVEQKIISELFSMGIPTADKILYRDIITGIGALCDLAEDVQYFLTVFVVKRHV